MNENSYLKNISSVRSGWKAGLSGMREVIFFDS